MKKGIKYIFMASIAALAAVSCNKNLPPVFDDANAFVAFSSSSVTVSENDGVVKIPVSLASVAGLEGSVSFTAVPDTLVKEGVKIYPQEGVNYEILTEGGTLKFDAQHRTQYIEVKGIPDGKYTGDLSVTITLSSKNMGLGYAKTCKVVINDEDHPLAAILGAYSAQTDGEASGDNPWTMTILKDKDDDHKVWIDNFFDNAGWAGDDMLVYGIVTEEDGELVKITVPFGQVMEYKYSGTYDIFCLGMDMDDNLYDKGEGEWEITIINGEKTALDFGSEYGIYCGLELGYISYVYPHITAVKQ